MNRESCAPWYYGWMKRICVRILPRLNCNRASRLTNIEVTKNSSSSCQGHWELLHHDAPRGFTLIKPSRSCAHFRSRPPYGNFNLVESHLVGIVGCVCQFVLAVDLCGDTVQRLLDGILTPLLVVGATRVAGEVLQ